MSRWGYNRLKARLGSDQIARSEDGRFGLHVPHNLLDEMFLHCTRSFPKETGGILIGRYSSDLRVAHVTDVVPAPGDSIARRFSFQRGVQGLQEMLRRVWPERKYYLGEWHFHPDGSALPSSTDNDQMRTISGGLGYHCPEPVILIIGGKPPEDVEIQSYVFRRGFRDAITLHFERRSEGHNLTQVDT